MDGHKWWWIYGPPNPRYTDAQIKEALTKQGSGSDDTIKAAHDALTAEFEKAVGAHDTINTRAAALPAVVLAIGAFSVGTLARPEFVIPAFAAFLVAAVSGLITTICVFKALMAGRFDFGPDAVRAAQAIATQKTAYTQALLNSMAYVTQHALDSIGRKGWWFNMALAAGLTSVLGALVLKLLGAGK